MRTANFGFMKQPRCNRKAVLRRYTFNNEPPVSWKKLNGGQCGVRIIAYEGESIYTSLFIRIHLHWRWSQACSPTFSSTNLSWRKLMLCVGETLMKWPSSCYPVNCERVRYLCVVCVFHSAKIWCLLPLVCKRNIVDCSDDKRRDEIVRQPGWNTHNNA